MRAPCVACAASACSMQVDLCSGHPDRVCLLTTTHKICICICICLQHAPLGAKHAQSGAVLPRELRLIARTTAATTAATAAAAVTTAAATTAASTAAATAATTTAAAATTAAATTAAATAATTTTATVTTAAITAAAVTAAAVTPRLALPWEDERHELNAPVGWQDRREPARRGAPADHTTAVVDGGVIAGVCTTAITTAVVWSAGAPVGPRCTTATTPQR